MVPPWGATCNVAQAYCPPVDSTPVQNGSYVPLPASHNLSTPVVVAYSPDNVTPKGAPLGTTIRKTTYSNRKFDIIDPNG